MVYRIVAALFCVCGLLTTAEAKSPESSYPVVDVHRVGGATMGIVEGKPVRAVKRLARHKVQSRHRYAKAPRPVHVARPPAVIERPHPVVAAIIEPIKQVIEAVASGVDAVMGETEMMFPRAIVAAAVVDEARGYLVKTATPGGTMTTLGPAVAIGHLHPVFAVRLARSVREGRAAGLSGLGIFSAFRPPSLRVGGFRDKFNSWHAAGAAVDMAGVSTTARAMLWQKIANANGLYLPYGPHNAAERNHTQLLMLPTTTPAVRKTLTVDGTTDVRRMWLASGIALDLVEAVSVVQSAVFGGGSRRHYAARSHPAKVKYVKSYHRHHHRVRYAGAG